MYLVVVYAPGTAAVQQIVPFAETVVKVALLAVDGRWETWSWATAAHIYLHSPNEVATSSVAPVIPLNPYYTFYDYDTYSSMIHIYTMQKNARRTRADPALVSKVKKGSTYDIRSILLRIIRHGTAAVYVHKCIYDSTVIVPQG